MENSKQDWIQYSNFDWTNEQYSYTIFGTLSSRTSPVVAGKSAGKISKMADIPLEASAMEGADKVGLRRDTYLFLKRFVLKQSRYSGTFLKASNLSF